MTTGNKATAPLCSVGDKDTSDGAEEPAQDVRPNLETSKAAKKAAIATAYRKALAKDGTAEEQQFPEGRPAKSTLQNSMETVFTSTKGKSLFLNGFDSFKTIDPPRNVLMIQQDRDKTF
ncbi:hypothetical protein RvY_18469 [Ramazzottius varieornatus]|uniref:Uncharacterized protein n=1 Tax=Ramazzottius varieornatus TaxID=947166 RepID=A0A1D1W7F5_RAMVA|nr:hypothetical protein RvY_18469 [Ramazzottius varieornatus]